MYKTYFKRIIDLFLAITGLVILSPLLLAATICLYFTNQGKPFFIQTRPGKNEHLFNIIKFKTMNDKTDQNGNLLSDKERLTKIGSLIRKTSLDEVPQLINVIKGDMSLIGPRPLLPKYLSLYNADQKRRHLVRPGITGWAQVNGRNAISWEQKFKYDVWYIDNVTFITDLKIIFKTIAKIIKSEGIKSNNSSTMEEFEGN